MTTFPSSITPAEHPDLFYAMLATPLHPAWSRHDPMPDWLTTFRPHQMIATQEIMTAFERTNTVILDAPVGAGKTAISEMVRRLLGVSGLYVCSTKTLQDQFVEDFPHSRVLKGRGNYPTQYGQWPDITAADCDRSPASACSWCEQLSACSYNSAKMAALASSTPVINTAYFLTEANGPGAFGHENPRGLVTIDEADLLENALMSHTEVKIGEWWRNKLRIGMPEVKTESAKSNDWVEWAQGAYEAADWYVSNLRTSTGDVKAIRHRKRAMNLRSKLDDLRHGLEAGGWVYDGYNWKPPTVLFKPIKVDALGPQALWRHGERFLLMSGSVISSREMADSLGIVDYESVNVQVNWDANRRPIVYAPVANVVRKNPDANRVVAEAVREIVEAHQGERVLVHSVSYFMAKEIMEALQGLGRPVLTYDNAGDREAALRAYKASEAAVIVAPSLDRGVDFYDDLARVQIVAKVPYMSLGDKQVSARTHTGQAGQLWFSVQVIRSFIQMIGRGMRHKDDWCVTYVLDQQWGKQMRTNRALIPAWVKAATVVKGERPWLNGGVRIET